MIVFIIINEFLNEIAAMICDTEHIKLSNFEENKFEKSGLLPSKKFLMNSKITAAFNKMKSLDVEKFKLNSQNHYCTAAVYLKKI